MNDHGEDVVDMARTHHPRVIDMKSDGMWPPQQPPRPPRADFPWLSSEKAVTKSARRCPKTPSCIFASVLWVFTEKNVVDR